VQRRGEAVNGDVRKGDAKKAQRWGEGEREGKSAWKQSILAAIRVMECGMEREEQGEERRERGGGQSEDREDAR
jgi:hypothetical protein